MSKDIFGVLLAVAAVVIVWLWASGRIANVWNAVKGGSSPSTEQQTSAGSTTTAPTGNLTPLPTDVIGSLPFPATATGAPTYASAADVLAQFGQEIVPASFPTWQTSMIPNANTSPAEMTLAPPIFTYV